MGVSTFVQPRLLSGLPTELLIKMMKEMGVRALGSFILSHKRFYEIFKANEVTIITTVLFSQPELENLLLLYTMHGREFGDGAMLYPRTIMFDPGRGPHERIAFMKSAVGFKDGKLICPRKIDFKLSDLANLCLLVRTIDWWVEEYPRLRWHDDPEDRRCLRTGEEVRLRKAVSRWWLYAECFHGKYLRSAVLPRLWEDDGRLHHLRVLSSVEIQELSDLWGTVSATVARDLCSSIDLDEFVAGNLRTWGWELDREENIVNTYLKLDPEQIRFLLENKPRLRREGIIREAIASQDRFEADVETLSTAIDIALQERAMLKPPTVSYVPPSGIIDEDVYVDTKGTFSKDAWPTGKPPLTKYEIAAFPQAPRRYISHGDAGAVWISSGFWGGSRSW